MESGLANVHQSNTGITIESMQLSVTNTEISLWPKSGPEMARIGRKII